MSHACVGKPAHIFMRQAHKSNECVDVCMQGVRVGCQERHDHQLLLQQQEPIQGQPILFPTLPCLQCPWHLSVPWPMAALPLRLWPMAQPLSRLVSASGPCSWWCSTRAVGCGTCRSPRSPSTRSTPSPPTTSCPSVRPIYHTCPWRPLT